MHPHRHGLTLLEVIIAVAIFMVAAAALFEGLVTAKRYSTMGAVQDELQETIDDTVRAVSGDLARTGWYFYQPPSPAAPIDYAASSLAQDRALRYFPFVQYDTATARGGAWPARSYATATEPNELAAVSPWTPLRSWAASTVAARRLAVADALRVRKVVAGDDIVAEIAEPSADLVFLRVQTSGTVSTSPTDADAEVPADMGFFPGFRQDPATGEPVIPDGALPWDWRRPANHARLPNVLHASEWQDDDDDGTYEHRNQASETPYAAPARGAFLDMAAGGMALRIQWEALSTDKLYVDPTTGVDNNADPANLREFAYVVVPSPQGLGRLVRAHAVTITATPPGVGSRVGELVTTATAGARGWLIDKVISDHVVRAQWWTRRHDRSLGVNQVRARLVFGRVIRDAESGQRLLIHRVVHQVFSMRARNEYDDQVEAEGQVDSIATDVILENGI